MREFNFNLDARLFLLGYKSLNGRWIESEIHPAIEEARIYDICETYKFHLIPILLLFFTLDIDDSTPFRYILLFSQEREREKSDWRRIGRRRRFWSRNASCKPTWPVAQSWVIDVHKFNFTDFFLLSSPLDSLRLCLLEASTLLDLGLDLSHIPPSFTGRMRNFFQFLLWFSQLERFHCD